MQIGMMSPYSLSVYGGVQDQVLGLARAVRRSGHHVRVLGPCDGAPPEPGITSLGASLPTAANGSIAPIAPDISSSLRTIRALWDEEFDVLHLHEPIAPGPTQTALLTSTRPMLGTFHRSGASSAYGIPGVRYLASRLSRRVAVSADAAALAHSALGGTYDLLWNGVEVNRIRTAPPWPTDGPTVMFIGRDEPRKGLAVLLEAFSGLPPELRLWVAGPGTVTSSLRARYGGDGRISWLGEISTDEKFSRLRGADVFCVPSIAGESFGIVLLEGMAAGTPVVASDIPGYRNVARKGDEAALFPPGDHQELAKLIHQVLFGSERAEALVAAGDACAESFSMRHLADRYIEMYASVARR